MLKLAEHGLPVAGDTVGEFSKGPPRPGMVRSLGLPLLRPPASDRRRELTNGIGN